MADSKSIKDGFFCYDDIDGEFMLFDTEAEALARAEEIIEAERDLADEGWNEDIEGLVVGKITFVCRSTVLKERPSGEELEDGYDKEGEYWPEGLDYCSDYGMEPIKEVSDEVDE